MPTSYAPPTVVIKAQGAQSLISAGSRAPAVLLLGTAPQGPDVPIVIDPTVAPALYGSPASSASLGYTLPLMMQLVRSQRPPSGDASPMQFVVCRCGVSRAGTTVTGAFTVVALGPYAGSAGNTLYVQIQTDDNGALTRLTLWDSGGIPPTDDAPASTWVVVQAFDVSLGIYDFSTPQAIVNAVNGANNASNPASVVQITVVADAVLPTAGLYALSGGADGKGTASVDPTLGDLLTASLRYQVDYIVAGYDANEIEGTISAHLSDARSQNQFRKAVLGPAQGVTFARLTTQPDEGDTSSWYNNFQSARIICVGHDSVILPNPITGTAGIYDGFYLAAAVCGLKVASPTFETCIGYSVAGVVGLPLPPDPSITTPLSITQLDTLSGAGFVVLQPEGGSYVIRDSLTTTRFLVNNQINPFSQWNVQDIDDAVSRVLLAAVLPFRGRAMPSLETANTLLQSACTGAMASLGQTINGTKSVTVTTDATTLVPTIDVVYITRFPFRTIEIRTSYVFV